jgi:hypothetical protein
MMITKIEETNIDEDINFVEIDLENHRKNIFNFELDLETRLNSFRECSLLEDVTDIISQLITLNLISSSFIVKEFLEKIIYDTDLNLTLKIECIKALENIKHYTHFLSLDYSSLNSSIILDFLVCFMNINSEESKKLIIFHFSKLLRDYNLEDIFRYKMISGLSFKLKIKELKDYYSLKFFKIFALDEHNDVRFRILAFQPLLQNKKYKLENSILEICRNEALDYNTRADAVDLLLNSGSENTKKEAEQILYNLSGGDSVKTIFENSQNVHVKEIEESAEKTLEKLQQFVYNKVSFEEIKRKLELDLTRIELDNQLYSKHSLTLKSILVLVYSYIQQLNDENLKVELTNRLTEEIKEARNLCSSGYASRLLNVFSGYVSDLGISISFEDQIIANFSGRLNYKAKQLEDVELLTLVLEEMMMPNHQFEKRINFLNFFREHMPSIRLELYEEFKDYVSDTDFDLYLRKAIMKYEGC